MKLKSIIRKGKLGTEIYVEDKNAGGYTAYFKDFPKLVTQGETIKEAQKHLWNAMYDALQFLLKK